MSLLGQNEPSPPRGGAASFGANSIVDPKKLAEPVLAPETRLAPKALVNPEEL
jgi:hypothetical protein